MAAGTSLLLVERFFKLDWDEEVPKHLKHDLASMGLFIPHSCLSTYITRSVLLHTPWLDPNDLIEVWWVKRRRLGEARRSYGQILLLCRQESLIRFLSGL